MRRSVLGYLLVCVLITACTPLQMTARAGVPAAQSVVQATATPQATVQLASQATPDTAQLPLLATRRAQIDTILHQPNPMLALDHLPQAEAAAEAIALADPRVQALARPSTPEITGTLLVEVFGVYPVQASDITTATTACAQAPCYRVELYNWGLNSTHMVIVQVATRAVLTLTTYPDTQPTIIPQHLTDLATQIAVHTPEVRDALGVQPDAAMVRQPEMKTTVSRCERSQHLCIVPTFVWGDRVLWALIDLTASRLVGVEWTNVGVSSKRAVSEVPLQNEAVTATYCDHDTALQRDGWQLSYRLTTSDGLRVADVTFQGRSIARSLKLVDVQVAYTPTGNSDAVGYTDALGCPTFSSAAVLPWNGPTIEAIQASDGTKGFALVQEYRSDLWPAPCNYSYRQRFEFYTDGRFRPVFGSIGRGCGNNGTYRPILRIALAAQATTFAEWDGTAWQPWSNERWQLQRPETRYTPEGYQYRITDRDTNTEFFIEPSNGQFGPDSRGDHAYLYVTRWHTDRDEGDSDLPTIGACCRTDALQGPNRFMDTPPESIADDPVVLWYVPQLKNNDTPGQQYCWADSVLQHGVFEPEIWPCYGGPMFVPRPTTPGR